LGRILVGVDAEIAKVATFAAKRNVIVETEGSGARLRTVEETVQTWQVILAPKGKRRIIGYEIVSRFGFAFVA